MRLAAVLALVALLTLSAAGCGPQPVRINAGGSTFVDPLMQKWAAVYRRAHGIEVDYIKKGSGYGIQQMTERNIVFGCTDTPMSRRETARAEAEGGSVIHVPVAMAAVAVVYNLPEVEVPLRLTGPLLADIFLHRVTRWNDPALAAANPRLALPDAAIVTVTRAESSGTTNVFTEYLGKVSAHFPAAMVSKKPHWPPGNIAQEGSHGVTSHVKTNLYTISYVEVLYAKKNRLQTALIQNASGEYIGPEPANVTAAAAQAIRHAATTEPYSLHDLTYSLTNAAGVDSYPIPAISYAVLYLKQDRPDGQAMVNFLKWVVTKGQQYAAELEYAPLPPELTERALVKLDRVVVK